MLAEDTTGYHILLDMKQKVYGKPSACYVLEENGLNTIIIITCKQSNAMLGLMDLLLIG